LTLIATAPRGHALVADGHGATAAEEAAVQQALRTLRRD
jgi:serine/threonine protein phosphatase PrpC